MHSESSAREEVIDIISGFKSPVSYLSNYFVFLTGGHECSHWGELRHVSEGFDGLRQRGRPPSSRIKTTTLVVLFPDFVNFVSWTFLAILYFYPLVDDIT